jgi:anti-sigma factor RsiW
MNCRDSESLILAERDGALAPSQLAALSEHVAGCPACRALRRDLATALAAYHTAVREVPVPDADEAWRDLQDRLREPAPSRKRGPLAPVIWFAAPLAAAAAFVFAFLVTRPAPEPVLPSEAALTTARIDPPPPPRHDPSFNAGADFVEAGDPDASMLVFVDAESGWLVVWATTEPVPETRG